MKVLILLFFFCSLLSSFFLLVWSAFLIFIFTRNFMLFFFEDYVCISINALNYRYNMANDLLVNWHWVFHVRVSALAEKTGLNILWYKLYVHLSNNNVYWHRVFFIKNSCLCQRDGFEYIEILTVCMCISLTSDNKNESHPLDNS